MLQLILALALVAPEQTLFTYRSMTGTAEPTVAASRERAVVAWNELDGNGVSRIAIAPLDALGKLAGPKLPLPRQREDGTQYAVSPVLASDGRDLLLAWQEGRAYDNAPRIITLRLDEGLRPDYSTMHELTPLRSVPFRGVQLAWNGTAYDVVAYETRWRIDATGRETERSAWFKADTIASAGTGNVATAWFETRQKNSPLHCGFSSCYSTITYTYAVTTDVAIGGATRSQTLERSWYSGNPPALAATMHDHMLAWYGNGRVETQRLDLAGAPNEPSRFFESYPLSTRATPPQITSDGSRYLVVWTWDDTVGQFGVEAAIDDEGKLTRFVLPTSIRPSATPRLTSLGDGRFLAVYAYNGVAYSQLIETGSPKRRVTR